MNIRILSGEKAPKKTKEKVRVKERERATDVENIHKKERAQAHAHLTSTHQTHPNYKHIDRNSCCKNHIESHCSQIYAVLQTFRGG